MLFKNHEKLMNNPNLKLKNVPGSYTVMGGVLIILSGILVACGNKITHSGNAPVRSASVYSKNTMGGPPVNVVAADTYRVCDASGCTDSVTTKKSISALRANYSDKQNNLRRLKPPILLVKKMGMKNRVNTIRIGRHMNTIVSRKRHSKYRVPITNDVPLQRAKAKFMANKMPTKIKTRLTGRVGSVVKGEKRQRLKLKNIIGVRFKHNRSDLSKNEKDKLDTLLTRIKKSKNIYIAGYVDNTSQFSKSYQKLLASKRAIAIARYFKTRGIKASKFKVGAYGKCCFGSLNDLKGINQYFRRAELYFNHELLLRHARIKHPNKLLSDRRMNPSHMWN